MPEPVIDRPVDATERIYLFSKSRRYFYDVEAVKEPAKSDHPSGNNRGQDDQWQPTIKRNQWNYWIISRETNNKDAHYATFPTTIPRRAILADTSERGCCPTCLASYKRVSGATLGWEPTCSCSQNQNPIPCTILDPFLGAGTSALVAQQLNRSFIGIELNSDYIDITKRRCNF